MALVIDSSFLAAALIERNDVGEWARELLRGQHEDDLFSPHLLQVEVLSVLRKKARGGQLSDHEVSSALRTLTELPVRQLPLDGWLLTRAWELRENVSPYDAWYVATAEWLRAPLATCDHRLVQATGPRCPFVTMGAT